MTIVDFFKRLFGRGDATDTEAPSGTAVVVPPDTSGKPIVAGDVEADDPPAGTPH